MNQNKVIVFCALVFVVGFVVGSVTAVISTDQLEKTDKQETLKICHSNIVKYNDLLKEMVSSVILYNETVEEFGQIPGANDLSWSIANSQNTLRMTYGQLDISCPQDLMSNVMTVEQAIAQIEK